MRLFGDILPFIGWREVDEELIDYTAKQVGDSSVIDCSRRYSGFQIEWWFIHIVLSAKDVGPRSSKTDV